MQEPGGKRLTVREKNSTYADESVPRAVASEAPSNMSTAEASLATARGTDSEVVRIGIVVKEEQKKARRAKNFDFVGAWVKIRVLAGWRAGLRRREHPGHTLQPTAQLWNSKHSHPNAGGR